MIYPDISGVSTSNTIPTSPAWHHQLIAEIVKGRWNQNKDCVSTPNLTHVASHGDDFDQGKHYETCLGILKLAGPNQIARKEEVNNKTFSPIPLFLFLLDGFHYLSFLFSVNGKKGQIGAINKRKATTNKSS